MGRPLILLGILLILAGLVIEIPGSFWSRVPGNIEFKGTNWRIYFPLGLSVLISVLATLVLWLFGRR